MIPFSMIAGTSLLAGGEDLLRPADASGSSRYEPTLLQSMPIVNSGGTDRTPFMLPISEPSIVQPMPIVNSGGTDRTPFVRSFFPMLPISEPTLISAQPIVGSAPDPMARSGASSTSGTSGGGGGGGQLRPTSSLVSPLTAPGDTLPGTADDKRTAQIIMAVALVALLWFWFGRHA